MAETLMQIKVADIIPTPDNPRIVDTTSEKFKELLESVKAIGVKMALMVRPHPTKKGKYDLRAGERRYMAANLAGLKTVPAIVNDDMTDEQAFDFTFIENFNREDLTPLEEGKAVAILMEKHNNDVAAVAAKVGHSEKWVRLRANVHKNLSERWQKEISKGDKGKSRKWTIGHYELIARLPVELQDEFLGALEVWKTDDMTIKELAEKIDRTSLLIATAPWKKDDAELLPSAGACSKCQKRSGFQPELWDNLEDEKAIAKNDKCLSTSCWKEKSNAYLLKRAEELKAKYPELLFISRENYYKGSETKTAQDLLKVDAMLAVNYSTLKKTDKDATPAMLIDGSGVGTLKWIKPKKDKSGESRSSSTGKSKGGAKSLAEKRKELDRKRWNWILLQMRAGLDTATIESIKYENKALALMSLISQFGTQPNAYGLCKKFAVVEEAYRENNGSIRDGLLIALWDLIKPNLNEEIFYSGPVTQVPDGKIEQAKGLANLLGIDIEGLQKDAEAEIPEPKSWAKEKEVEAEKPVKKTAKKVKPEKTAKKKPKPIEEDEDYEDEEGEAA